MIGARLRQGGVEDIRIVEKGGDFGGTWYWNRYPGAACDTEAYIYLPLLEETGYIPTEKYAKAPEILAHSRRIAEHYDLYRNVLFQTQITELRWDEASSRWIVSTDRGDRFKAQYVCMANGPLNRPKLPGVPGVEFVQRPFVPYEPLGLRVHRRRQLRQSDRPEGQTRRHHRHRRNRGAVRTARRCKREADVPVSSARRRRSTCARTVRPTQTGRSR